MCSCLKWSSPSPVLEDHHEPQNKRSITSSSINSSPEKTSKNDFLLKIVHAGGRVELYNKAVHVSILTQKYPGMCIARPSVFKRPHESVLSSDELLLPGNKYFVIRSSTVEKLKKRRRGSSVEEGEKKEDNEEDLSVCSGDFAVSKHGWSVLRKHVKEGGVGFVKPIQQRPNRFWKESEWEPIV